MIKVFLSGGMGNHLFQLSFARYLRDILNYSVAIVSLDILKTDDALDMSTIIDINSREKSNLPLSNIAIRLIDPWRTKSVHYIWGARHDFRHFAQVSPTNIPLLRKNSHVVGYFQNYKFVQFVEKNLLQDLRFHLPQNLKDLEEISYEVIHVRGTDYKKIANRMTLGELSDCYYNSVLPKKSDLLRVCITDDLEFARWKLRKISVDLFLGPREIDTFRAMKIMQGAHRLIVANSTFSWWGGLAAWNSHNSEVIVPKPFFRSSQLDFGNGLEYPDFSTHNASWE